MTYIEVKVLRDIQDWYFKILDKSDISNILLGINMYIIYI